MFNFNSSLPELEKNCQFILSLHYEFYKIEGSRWEEFHAFKYLCEIHFPEKNKLEWDSIRFKLDQDGYLKPVGEIAPLINKRHKLTEKGVIFYSTGGYLAQHKESKRKKINDKLTVVATITSAIAATIGLYAIFKPETKNPGYSNSQIDSLIDVKFKQYQNNKNKVDTNYHSQKKPMKGRIR